MVEAAGTNRRELTFAQKREMISLMRKRHEHNGLGFSKLKAAVESNLLNPVTACKRVQKYNSVDFEILKDMASNPSMKDALATIKKKEIISLLSTGKPEDALKAVEALAIGCQLKLFGLLAPKALLEIATTNRDDEVRARAVDAYMSLSENGSTHVLNAIMENPHVGIAAYMVQRLRERSQTGKIDLWVSIASDKRFDPVFAEELGMVAVKTLGDERKLEDLYILSKSAVSSKVKERALDAIRFWDNWDRSGAFLVGKVAGFLVD